MVLEGDFRFVPIMMSDQSLKTSRELGKAISSAVQGKNVLLVASSDLSHFHHQDEAYLLDQRIIGKLEEMDESQIARLLEKRKSEACGAGAIIAVLSAAKAGRRKMFHSALYHLCRYTVRRSNQRCRIRFRRADP